MDSFAIPDDCIDQAVTEGKTLFVRLRIIPVREDPCPANRGAEWLEAKLSQKLQVLLIGVVEIDAPALRKDPVLGLDGLLHGSGRRLAVVLAGKRHIGMVLIEIGDSEPLAAFCIGTLEQVCLQYRDIFGSHRCPPGRGASWS